MARFETTNLPPLANLVTVFIWFNYGLNSLSTSKQEQRLHVVRRRTIYCMKRVLSTTSLMSTAEYWTDLTRWMLHFSLLHIFIWTTLLRLFYTKRFTKCRKNVLSWLSSLCTQTNFRRCFNYFSLQCQMRLSWHALRSVQQLSSIERVWCQKRKTQAPWLPQNSPNAAIRYICLLLHLYANVKI